MEIVKDVNVRKLKEFDIENDLYHDVLYENMFDDGIYTDNYYDEAVGFIYSNACYTEMDGNAMYISRIKGCDDKNLLTTTANDLVNNLMGTEKEKYITEENNGITLLTYDGIYFNIFVNLKKHHIQILAYQEA